VADILKAVLLLNAPPSLAAILGQSEARQRLKRYIAPLESRMPSPLRVSEWPERVEAVAPNVAIGVGARKAAEVARVFGTELSEQLYPPQPDPDWWTSFRGQSSWKLDPGWIQGWSERHPMPVPQTNAFPWASQVPGATYMGGGPRTLFAQQALGNLPQMARLGELGGGARLATGTAGALTSTAAAYGVPWAVASQLPWMLPLAVASIPLAAAAVSPTQRQRLGQGVNQASALWQWLGQKVPFSLPTVTNWLARR